MSISITKNNTPPFQKEEEKKQKTPINLVYSRI